MAAGVRKTERAGVKRDVPREFWGVLRCPVCLLATGVTSPPGFHGLPALVAFLGAFPARGLHFLRVDQGGTNESLGIGLTTVSSCDSLMVWTLSPYINWFLSEKEFCDESVRWSRGMLSPGQLAVHAAVKLYQFCQFCQR